jgi:hypothetical protein
MEFFEWRENPPPFIPVLFTLLKWKSNEFYEGRMHEASPNNATTSCLKMIGLLLELGHSSPE